MFVSSLLHKAIGQRGSGTTAPPDATGRPAGAGAGGRATAPGDTVGGAAEPAPDGTTDRILEAALRQFELFGVARSTVEQITKRSGLSRVTLYRRFPGKQQLIEAVILRELHTMLDALDAELDRLPSPEQKISGGFVFIVGAVRGHTLLNRLLDSEPESVLPHFTQQGAPVIAAARDYLAGRLARDYPDDQRTLADLQVAAEVVVRLIISFLLTPRSVVDLDDPGVLVDFAERYVAPLLRPEAS